MVRTKSVIVTPPALKRPQWEIVLYHKSTLGLGFECWSHSSKSYKAHYVLHDKIVVWEALMECEKLWSEMERASDRADSAQQLENPPNFPVRDCLRILAANGIYRTADCKFWIDVSTGFFAKDIGIRNKLRLNMSRLYVKDMHDGWSIRIPTQWNPLY